MRFSIFVLMLFVAIAPCSSGNAQQFIDGINLYNRAQYDSLIAMVPGFVAENPDEAGLARYFAAESHYNLAMLATDEERVTYHLQHAWQDFQKAQQSPDLRQDYQDYYHFARYKMGWCSYRLAELQSDQKHFQRAYDEFLDFTPDAPDSVKAFSCLMAVQSRMHALKSSFLSLTDIEFEQQSLDEVLQAEAVLQTLIRQAQSFADGAKGPVLSPDLKRLARLQAEMLRFDYASFYQMLSLGLFPGLEDAEKRSVYRELSLAYLRDLNLDFSPDDPAFHQDFSSELSYLEMMRHLNRFFLTRANAEQRAFLQAFKQLRAPEFAVERDFRRANLAHADTDAAGREFNQVALSFYDAARSEQPEAYYWLGYIFMIQGERERSRENLVAFLSAYQDAEKHSRRQEILLEDAKYRKYLLDFERYYLGRDTKKLRDLAAELKEFEPRNRDVNIRKEQLNLLTNCSITRNTAQIWSRVLEGTDDEKLQQVLSTIRFILPRAALNIGRVRARYLNLLYRLFNITEVRLRNETRFFRGIVKSLEAEIEATPWGKVDKFREAAQAIRGVSHDYENKNEAEYIRARCLFFADEFKAATDILIPLVNRQKSLRALFYLAEIFRLDNRGRAARKCFETIIHKLEQTDYVYDDFWQANAMAGLESSEKTGSLAILDSIDIDGVVFQPSHNPDLLTYEMLAEEKFLKSQFARESVEWLMRYGLPPKQFYPSEHRLHPALRPRMNLFANAPFLLDEMRGPITSSLQVKVILPETVSSEVVIKLGNERLQAKDGTYLKRFIPLNSELELSAENPECYEFKLMHTFSQPGLDYMAIVLNKRLNFVAPEPFAQTIQERDYPLPLRWDNNYVLSDLPSQSGESELRADYGNLIELRDCALDTFANRILVVNARLNEIWVYSNDSASKRVGKLEPQLDSPLNSPEGIAVDAMGNIYIVDWGNHRIVRCDNRGKQQQIIGSLGENNRQTTGAPIHLMYPTRIAIIEQPAKASWPEYQIGQDYVYIADQNGIHIAKLNGAYLDTLIPPQQRFPAGSFYGFYASGLGHGARLFLVKRVADDNGRVFEFVSR